MTNLNTYLKTETFGSDAKGLPEGETELELASVEVEEASVVFDGKPRKRFILRVGEEAFWVGQKVMKGIQRCVKDDNAKKVKVIRQGQGKETSYVVQTIE